MDLSTKKRLAAAALIISGITAYVAPFLLHSPATQGSTGPNTNDNNDNNNDNNNAGDTGNQGGQGAGPKKKSFSDLLNGDCQTTNYGTWRSLQARSGSMERAGDDSPRSEHQVAALLHKLNTPAAEKHVGQCLSDLKATVTEMMTSS